ncbi:MAG: polysaccharide biosynthesis tyrosine autokinase [Pseudothermotoga sp.]
MNNENTEITLKDIVAIFKRRFWLFASIFVITCFVTLVYLLFFAKPVYKATAQLLVASSGGQTINIPSQAAQLLGINVGTGPDVNTEVELIKSRATLEKLVEQLNLLELFKAKAKKDSDVDIQDIVNTISNKWIEVEAVKSSKIIELSVEHEDPQLAAKIANTLVELYLELKSRLSTNEYTAKLNFIESQLPRVEQELKGVEDRIKKFKEENQIYALSDQAANLVKYIAQFDAMVNEYLLNIQQTKAGIKAAEDMLKKVDQKIISSETISTNPVVQQLRSKLVDLQVQLSALLQSYSEDDRRVVSLKKQIEETQDLLQKEIAKVVSAEVQTINPAYSQLYTELILKQTQLQVFEASLSAVQKIRDDYLKKASIVPTVEQKLFELERERQAKQTTYLALLAQYEQARIGAAGTVENVKVVSSAMVPNKPSKPNKRLVLAIGGVLGIFLGILAAFVRDATDKRFRTEDEIERIFPKTVLGKIHFSKTPSGFIANENEMREDFKQIAVKIWASSMNNVIGVTSFESKEGKTFVAVNLAHILSKMSRRVLIVDLNSHAPRLKEIFHGGTEQPGLLSLLKDGDLEKSVLKFSENLDVLCLERNDDWLMGNSKLAEVIATLSKNYDEVIVDMPHLTSADGLLAAQLVGQMIVVVKLGKTRKELIIHLDNSKLHDRLLGLVVQGK